VALSLQGSAERQRDLCTTDDLSLELHKNATRLLIDAKGLQHLLFENDTSALPIALDGCSVLIGAVRVTFRVPGLAQLDRARASLAALISLLCPGDAPVSVVQRWTATSLQMRDALIALDGHCVGATYRDISEVIFGSKRTQEAWRSSSTALKDRIRRALKRGLWLSGGGYRQLL
jgi:hypothetical protein